MRTFGQRLELEVDQLSYFSDAELVRYVYCTYLAELCLMAFQV